MIKIQFALLMLLIGTAQGARHELDNGMYYDDITGLLEPAKYVNEDIMAPWNNPVGRDDIMAPWNDPIRADDITAPWNNPVASPQDSNRYMHDTGVQNSSFYQIGY